MTQAPARRKPRIATAQTSARTTTSNRARSHGAGRTKPITTLTTAPVTVTPAGGVPAGTTTGSFLVRYQLGWQSGANPYTPPGTYSFPVVFTIQQGQ